MPRTRPVLAALWFPVAVFAQDWPQWRGPHGDGFAAPQRAPLQWSKAENVKWRTPLAQAGNGSPIVANGRVFLTMREDDQGRKRSLYCFDRDRGGALWVRTIDFDRVMPTHATNPHCSTTPASDGERVVVWHASAGLFCYDFAGELLWQRDLGEFRHQWGHGTSPVLHDGKVILHSGPGRQSFVAAFDLATGEDIWRVDEPDHLTAEQIAKKRLVGSWCTPVVHRVGERDLVLCAQPTRVVAYDAGSGEVVWSCQGVACDKGDLTYSSPVIAGDVCVVQGGYEGPSVGVRMDGEGDVTATHRLWRHDIKMSNCASGIFADGAIFIPDLGGFLRCLDARSGVTRWRARIGRGQTWGSIVAADDRLYLMNQNGRTIVFEPNATELVVLAENDLGEATNSTPVISGGEIFLRTHEALWCIAGESR